MALTWEQLTFKTALSVNCAGSFSRRSATAPSRRELEETITKRLIRRAFARHLPQPGKANIDGRFGDTIYSDSFAVYDGSDRQEKRRASAVLSISDTNTDKHSETPAAPDVSGSRRT